MRIIESDAGLRALAENMNETASLAAALLIKQLLDDPSILQQMGDRYANAFATACCVAMEQNGFDLERDQARIKQFYEDNADSIQCLAISTVLRIIRDSQNGATPGWIGKALAFGAGALIASILGG